MLMRTGVVHTIFILVDVVLSEPSGRSFYMYFVGAGREHVSAAVSPKSAFAAASAAAGFESEP